MKGGQPRAEQRNTSPLTLPPPRTRHGFQEEREGEDERERVRETTGWCIIDPSVCGLGKKRSLRLGSRKRGADITPDRRHSATERERTRLTGADILEMRSPLLPDSAYHPNEPSLSLIKFKILVEKPTLKSYFLLLSETIRMQRMETFVAILFFLARKDIRQDYFMRK